MPTDEQIRDRLNALEEHVRQILCARLLMMTSEEIGPILAIDPEEVSRIYWKTYTILRSPPELSWDELQPWLRQLPRNQWAQLMGEELSALVTDPWRPARMGFHCPPCREFHRRGICPRHERKKADTY